MPKIPESIKLDMDNGGPPIILVRNTGRLPFTDERDLVLVKDGLHEFILFREDVKKIAEWFNLILK